MEVTFQDTMKRFKVLNILEFDSIRRCMSVIVQDEKGIAFHKRFFAIWQSGYIGWYVLQLSY